MAEEGLGIKKSRRNEEFDSVEIVDTEMAYQDKNEGFKGDRCIGARVTVS